MYLVLLQWNEETYLAVGGFRKVAPKELHDREDDGDSNDDDYDIYILTICLLVKSPLPRIAPRQCLRYVRRCFNNFLTSDNLGPHVSQKIRKQYQRNPILWRNGRSVCLLHIILSRREARH